MCVVVWPSHINKLTMFIKIQKKSRKHNFPKLPLEKNLHFSLLNIKDGPGALGRKWQAHLGRFGQAWSKEQVPGLSEIHREILSQILKNKKKRWLRNSFFSSIPLPRKVFFPHPWIISNRGGFLSSEIGIHWVESDSWSKERMEEVLPWNWNYSKRGVRLTCYLSQKRRKWRNKH